MNLAQMKLGRVTLGEAPPGFDVWLTAELAQRAGSPVIHVALDDARAAAFEAACAFFAPQLPVVTFPAWDCLPYDRVSPRAEIAARRIAAVAALDGAPPRPLMVITTVNGILQRIAPRSYVQSARLRVTPQLRIRLEDLAAFLERLGYARAGSVVEPGDFAVRGGIVDVFPSGFAAPVRIDFFGDTVESLRGFDPETQKSTGRIPELVLLPSSETPLDAESVSRFRTGYVAAFGPGGGDPLYEQVSARRKFAGMEHYLPLFHERLESLFDVLPGAPVTLDHQTDEAVTARLAQISEHFEARTAARGLAARASGLHFTDYKPLKPSQLYLTPEDWGAALKARPSRMFSPFRAAGGEDAGGAPARDFAPERTQNEGKVFDAAAAHIAALRAEGRRVVLACYTEGSLDRLSGVLDEHGAHSTAQVTSLAEIEQAPPGTFLRAVLPLEHGFSARGIAFLSEQDILGDRLVRQTRRTKKPSEFLAEAASLGLNDLVVHVEHGIGRFIGLRTIDVSGAPHDCLELQYDGGKLFLPVENIDLLTRFGADLDNITLDRLGGAGWQQRKAKLKNRIREIATELIRVAAERQLKRAPLLDAPQGLYDEFAARFPYAETEDQSRAIGDVMEDLAKGQPMDRLICGDVGFGKTEVALRAAFVTAMSGKQVAVIAPTTLLARQHLRTFSERFAGWPITVRALSRLVSAKEAAATRQGLADGKVEVVIGTHALLAKSVSFKALGLVIVDEEQHFGVVHKERLKTLKADVHVLTLSATPIPRTLQLALSGVRDMSLIATPPVDRLAVRTFVGPLDPVIVREALLREHYRGGQSFYVVPRIADLTETMKFLEETVPELKLVSAHGQQPPGQLDDTMNAFYDRKFEVLVSTTIVESGLDIPTANTMIVHRADMFGLAQLYQLRGRIGRSKLRAYAYLTTPQGKLLTPDAERRLHVLQSLDSLGAGFTLASHDLDMRGAGNLLGDEQTGHIREVGIELYQEMLEDAVAALRSGGLDSDDSAEWSPQINLGASVLIPEDYVADLDLRMGLYRRLALLEEQREIDAFGAELADRFGPLPPPVRQLLQIVAIKRLCRLASVEKIDAGPKGAVIAFRQNTFPNPQGLVALIGKDPKALKPRPDQKLVAVRDWPGVHERLNGAQMLLRQLAELAEAA